MNTSDMPRVAKWPELILAIIAASPIGRLLVGVLSLIIYFAYSIFSGDASFSMSGYPNEYFYYFLGCLIMSAVFGAPAITLTALLGHFLTRRRPTDGVYLGAIGGAVSALLIGLLSPSLIWSAIAIVPVASLLGYSICRIGYRASSTV